MIIELSVACGIYSAIINRICNKDKDLLKIIQQIEDINEIKRLNNKFILSIVKPILLIWIIIIPISYYLFSLKYSGWEADLFFGVPLWIFEYLFTVMITQKVTEFILERYDFF